MTTDAERIARMVNAAAKTNPDDEFISREIAAMYKTQRDAGFMILCLLMHAAKITTDCLAWEARRLGKERLPGAMYEPDLEVANGSANAEMILRIWTALMNDDVDMARCFIAVVVNEDRGTTCEALGMAVALVSRSAKTAMHAYTGGRG